MDTANCIPDALYRLGFQGPGDIALAGTWVTVAELYQWADEAAKKIAYESGVFITYDTSIAVTSGTAVWSLPASNVFTLAAWLGSNALRITPVRELWALDGTWTATSGPSTRCSLDAGSVGTITLYPNPAVGGTLNQVAEEYAAPIALGSSTVALPSVLQDYFSYAMMAGARGKESDAAMPEMAAHFEERMKLYEQVIEHLYGPGQ
jgi:hypothetical protein